MADTRTYIKVHDGMPDHPKIDPLSDRAFRLVIELWCWCSRHLTDGHVPRGVWEKRANAATRQEVLKAGLIEDCETDLYMHDYLDHQRSKAEVIALRDVRQDAGKLGGKAKAKRLANAKQKLEQTASKPLPVSDTDTEEEHQDHYAERPGNPEQNGAIPLEPLEGKTYSETLARWFSNRGTEIPNRSTDPRGAYRAVVEITDHELGSKHPKHPWLPAHIIAEYIEEGTGEKFNDSAESHLRRLVKRSGALAAFDAMDQGVIWGAGIDPKYAEDPLSLTKYATTILSKDSA